MKLINESMYWHGTGRISNCLNRLLHEGLHCAPAIIVIIFFCKVKIFPLLEELPHNIFSLFYDRMKVNWVESANVTDMDHRPNGITCSTYLGSCNLCGYQFTNQDFFLCSCDRAS
jgi:hypothetical protein